MARRADQLAGEIERQPEPAIRLVEVELVEMLFADALDRPAPHQAAERLGQIFGQAERLADITHRPAGAVSLDDGGQGRTIAAIGLVDPLDDFFAAFMLEIDIDIGRLLALARHEPLEQQFVADRIDAGDAEDEAHAAIRGRPPPLAQDAPPPAFRDDGVHGEEVGRIAQLLDQPQLVADLVAVGLRHVA